MFQKLTFHEIYGIPLIVYGGLATLSLFLITALIGYLDLKGRTHVGVRWHSRIALLGVLSGLFHGLLGLLAYL